MLTHLRSQTWHENQAEIGSTSVVILNWNGKHYLKRCLDSIANQTYRPSEVIFVDNGSTDGSIKFVKKNFPWVRIVETGRNLGSSKGHNVGIREARGDYIAILDNDLYLDEDWLKEEVRAVSLPGVGIAGGSVRSYDPPHQSIFFPNRFFPSIQWPWAILSYRLVEEKVVETDTVQSCAMMVRREVFDKVGMLDEGFFFWNEDVDFCLRAKRALFKSAFNPKAVAYHRVGGIGGRMRRIMSFLEANVRYARKSYPFWQFLFAIVSVALANIIFLALRKGL